jgi:hypothetical protein
MLTANCDNDSKAVGRETVLDFPELMKGNERLQHFIGQIKATEDLSSVGIFGV